MKPAPFIYELPKTLDQALALLSEHGDEAKVLAGGQSLVPVMNFRLAQPGMLIDLNGIEGLDRLFVEADGTVVIGCMVRQAVLEKSELIQTHVPLMAETMPWIAHPQIRNRGTIGGSLAHADPAAELPVLMVALQAQFKLQRGDEVRFVAAEDFYVGLFETVLQDDELLTEIQIPARPVGAGYSFQEVARRHGDFAMAGVAAVVTCGADGICQSARLVYLNVGSGPVCASQAAAMLVGHLSSDDLIEKTAVYAANHEIDPSSDIHASADYRRHLAYVLGKRALKAAFVQATE